MGGGDVAGAVVGVVFSLLFIFIAYIVCTKYYWQRKKYIVLGQKNNNNKGQSYFTTRSDSGKIHVSGFEDVHNPINRDIEINATNTIDIDSRSNKRDDNNYHGSAIVNPMQIENQEDDDTEKYENVQTLGIVKSGYLYKKSSSLKKDWLRRWFFISDGKLFYCHVDTDIKDVKNIRARQVANLVISTVKEITTKEFQIISPGSRGSNYGGGVYELQSETEQEARDWISIIRQQIEGSLTLTLKSESSNDSTKSASSYNVPNAKVLKELHDANPYCADCGSIENVTWASLNLCIMICIECSGIHRSLGTHISKVRSLTLDKWSSFDIQLMTLIGNKRSNMIWEASLPSETMKITTSTTREQKEEYISDKYVKKLYLAATLRTIDANNLALRAAATGKIYNLMQAIAAGADLNTTWDSGEVDTYQTPLHLACEGDFALCVELLCINGANVNIKDYTNRLPIDIAKSRNKQDIVELLTYYSK